MKTRRVCTVVSSLVGLIFGLQGSIEARASTVAKAANRSLIGELVIADAAARQFHVVRCQGVFTAPAGISLTALEGKPVRVDIGSADLVLRIRQIPIHIDPITHHLDLVTGELVVRDPATRMFAIAGDDSLYAAPSGVDVSRYGGRLVEMRIAESGQVVGIEPIAHSTDAPPRSARQCFISDAGIAHGVAICRRGTTLRCTNGEWVDSGVACN